MEKEEDAGILKELLIGIRAQLNERLVSPLMPAIVIAWLVINYRLIFAVFSDEPLKDRFSFIDSALYPTGMDIFLKGLAFPTLIGVAYILVYPYPAKWFYKYSLIQRCIRRGWIYS